MTGCCWGGVAGSNTRASRLRNSSLARWRSRSRSFAANSLAMSSPAMRPTAQPGQHALHGGLLGVDAHGRVLHLDHLGLLPELQVHIRSGRIANPLGEAQASIRRNLRGAHPRRPPSVHSFHDVYQATSRWNSSRRNHLQCPNMDASPRHSGQPLPHGRR